MTLHELRNAAAHWAGFVGANEDPQFLAVVGRLLESTQLHYGRKWFLPRTHWETSVAAGTTTVNLPNAPYSNGVLSVSIDGKRIPVVDNYRLDNEYPDRDPTETGRVRFVEFDHTTGPTALRLWPAPDSAISRLRVYYAYRPAAMQSGNDEPWDGQFPDYHEIIALRAALQYVEKRLGEDSAEKLRDENPYGPLNAPNWLRRRLAEMEAEYNAQLSRLASSIPTAEPAGRWYSPGYPGSGSRGW